MGLFGKIFEKKSCDICGGDIGLLGNRKLEDGNLCKDCAAKLSPFFSERRRSTVEQIREQLDYRENNKEKVSAFHTTRVLGNMTKVYLDEDSRQFMVSGARNLADANPDVIDCSAVTNCKLDINENRTELKHDDKDGKKVSYVPPRYEYSYDFYIVINVNHPYFDEIRFKLNSSSIRITPPPARPTSTVSPLDYAKNNVEFQECEATGNEIVALLTGVRTQIREETASAAAPKATVICPFCMADTVPTADGRCEYCGGTLSL